MYCDSFRDRIQHIVEAKNRSLAGLNGQAGAVQLDPQQVFAEYREYATRLKPFVVDTTALLDAVESGKRVLSRAWARFGH
jgi:adenylosuccinate synthase